MEDARLATRIAAGGDDAFETLAERYRGAMHAVALRVTRNERTAEEVVQDALLAVWREPGRYDPGRGPLAPWLLTLTRYKAIDAVRREQAIQRRTADVDLEFREAPDDVHGEVWLRMRRERLYDAIATLVPEQRRALELAFIGGLTHVEVAEREGIPLGTAKTRIRTALLKLRDALGTTLDEDAFSLTEPAAASPVPRRPAGQPAGDRSPLGAGDRSAGRAPPIRGTRRSEPPASQAAEPRDS